MPAALPWLICCAQSPPWSGLSETAIGLQFCCESLFIPISPSLEDTCISNEGEAVLAAALGRTKLNDLYLSCEDGFPNPYPHSVHTTAEERMRAARNNPRWNEGQHYRTADDFRQGVAEALSCLGANVEDILPWDDVRRVIQGWCIARWRLRWGELESRPR